MKGKVQSVSIAIPVTERQKQRYVKAHISFVFINRSQKQKEKPYFLHLMQAPIRYFKWGVQIVTQ